MFRFTIRDMLWLTFVVALAGGWWVDHVSFIEWHRRQLRILRDELDGEHFEIYGGDDGFLHVDER
jgi:hypothetical protein